MVRRLSKAISMGEILLFLPSTLPTLLLPCRAYVFTATFLVVCNDVSSKLSSSKAQLPADSSSPEASSTLKCGSSTARFLALLSFMALLAFLILLPLGDLLPHTLSAHFFLSLLGPPNLVLSLQNRHSPQSSFLKQPSQLLQM